MKLEAVDLMKPRRNFKVNFTVIALYNLSVIVKLYLLLSSL